MSQQERPTKITKEAIREAPSVDQSDPEQEREYQVYDKEGQPRDYIPELEHFVHEGHPEDN